MPDNDLLPATKPASGLKPALPWLEIKQFRCFEHLLLEKLGRVNLIAGKNNVGKSSLLEAVQLYASGAAADALANFFIARGEFDAEDAKLMTGNHFVSYKPDVLSLFYGRPKIDDPSATIEMGFDQRRVAISFGWFREVQDKDNTRRIEKLANTAGSKADRTAAYAAIEIAVDGAVTRRLQLGLYLSSPPWLLTNGGGRRWPSQFVPADGLSGDALASLWDAVSLSALEDEVLRTMRIIEPKIERVVFVGESRNGGRRPQVKLSGGGFQPLASMGDGMGRLLGISLSLVSAKGGFLLIDEVENGIHYSIQSDVWRLIFENAERLNVQVFATTHSWDCVEGFQKASRDSHEGAGLVTRLELRKGRIVAVQYDQRELEIAARSQIEVR